MTNLAPLNSIDSGYHTIVSAVSERYVGEWNDSIHASYAKFVRQLEENAQEMRKIRCYAETLEKEIETLRIGELLGKAESLIKEADEL